MHLSGIIIDNDIKAINNLSSKLRHHCPKIEIVAQCLSGEEGIAAINTHQPDIVFLDIEMPPGMNGFQMLTQLDRSDFALIFVSAYNKYLLNALRVQALDFLVKPVTPEELKTAMERVVVHYQEKKEYTWLRSVRHMLAQLSGTGILINSSKGQRYIDPLSVIYIESTGNDSLLFLIEKEKLHSFGQNLKWFDKELDDHFCRIHKRYIINIIQIRTYQSKGNGGIVIMNEGAELPVGRAYKKAFEKRWKSE